MVIAEPAFLAILADHHIGVIVVGHGCDNVHPLDADSVATYRSWQHCLQRQRRQAALGHASPAWVLAPQWSDRDVPGTTADSIENLHRLRRRPEYACSTACQSFDKKRPGHSTTGLQLELLYNLEDCLSDYRLGHTNGQPTKQYGNAPPAPKHHFLPSIWARKAVPKNESLFDGPKASAEASLSGKSIVCSGLTHVILTIPPHMGQTPPFAHDSFRTWGFPASIGTRFSPDRSNLFGSLCQRQRP